MALRQGLRQLGWLEGQNLVLEIRIFEGQSAPLSALATELVDLQVDLICTGDRAAAHAAREVTGTMPIVGASLGPALESGLVASFAHPGGNVTGLSLQTEGLVKIWFELLKEALPSMTQVAILHHTRPGTSPRKDFEAAAHSLGIEPLLLSVQTAADFQAAFQMASQRQVQALVLGSSPLFGEHVGELAALARANRLPTIAFESFFAAAGGLMNYGPRITDNYHRAAMYIDRILKGTYPGELPVESPMRFYLILQRTFDMVSFCSTVITEEDRMQEPMTTAPAMDLTPQAMDNLVEELRAYHAIYSPLFQRREQREGAAQSLHGL